MKNMIQAVVVSLVMALASTATAGYWSLNCTNNSCKAEQGNIVIHYSSINHGILSVENVTGITGLPFSASDFQQQEQNISMSIEKSIGKSKRTSSGLDGSAGVGEGATGGAKIGNESSRDSSIVRKRGISNSKSFGGKVSVDHTLGFFLYYANEICITIPPNSLRKYQCAAEGMMLEYNNDGGQNISNMMYDYLFSRAAVNTLPELDMTRMSKNAETAELQRIKHAALANAPLGGDGRWSYGYKSITKASDTNKAKLDADFQADIKSLIEIMKPGQTAAKLEKANKRLLALAKFSVDGGIFDFSDPRFSGIKSLSDKYLVGIAAARAYGEKPDPDGKEAEQRFLDALKVNDPAVHLVTVQKQGVNPVTIVVPVVLIAVAGGGVWFTKRKNRQQTETQTTEEI